MIKAIETSYNGYRFRSRLEARWAVFFDALGIEYQYESEGFEIENYFDGPKKFWYLPDFYLPELKVWVEVKGSEEEFHKKINMYKSIVEYGGQLPHVSELLILGEIHNSKEGFTPLHSLFVWNKGPEERIVFFDDKLSALKGGKG